MIDEKKVIKTINECIKDGASPPGVKGGGPSSVRMAAKRLGIAPSTLRGRLERIQRNKSIIWEVPKTLVSMTSEMRLRDQLSETKKALAEAHRALNINNDLREKVFELSRMDISPPKWLLTPKKADSPGTPVLFTSDMQWGEFIRRDEMGGVNAFNLKIASERYKLLIQKTIDLSFSHMVNPKYNGIVLLRGGDAVSGNIHAELRETNDGTVMRAVNDLVDHEAWGIEELRRHFGSVWVISVPGNHGRTTIKPIHKQYVEDNFDTLSAWMLERHFKGDSNVKFLTPASGDALFNVAGTRFLLTHGDRIGSRGGQGFIGPAATIARGMKKIVDYYNTIGQKVDHVLVGHFHTYLELEYGFCNGSLAGFSEFARDGRFRPAPPIQLLFFVHKDHGITARWPIVLDKLGRHQLQSMEGYSEAI